MLEKVSLDLMEPLPTGQGGTHYILAILDIFSKYIKLYALKKVIAKAIIDRLIVNYIPKIDKPEGLLTDNGIKLRSKL